MKLFLDSANLDELKKVLGWGVINGVTTNPSLIAKEGIPIEERIREICALIHGDVSAEVIGTTAKEMIAEGRRLAALHPNIVVKVPMNQDGITAVAALTQESIRTNVTLCFSTAQALLAAKAGAYIVSPFIGRIEDLGWPGAQLIADIVKVYSLHSFRTQVLAASLRGPLHVVEAAKAGAHIATVPLRVLEQMFYHPLTEQGLDQFLTDHRQVFQLVSA